MIDVRIISPQNEVDIARELAAAIEDVWPDVAASKRDQIDILVGLRLPADIDLLVLMDLAQPREVPPRRRRGGGFSSSAFVQQAVIAIEVKQLDWSRFARIGTQLFPIYAGKPEVRSVNVQAADGGIAVRRFAQRWSAKTYVHHLAWLTAVDEDELRDID